MKSKALAVQSILEMTAVFGKPPFSDAAGGEYPRVSTRTDNDGVDFVTIRCHDQVCDHRGPAIFEVDGEGAGAIGVHCISARGSWVGEIGHDIAINGYGVNLTEPTRAVKLSHGHAHLWASGSRSCQLGALNRERIVAGDEFVVAGRGFLCAYPDPKAASVSRINATVFAISFLLIKPLLNLEIAFRAGTHAMCISAARGGKSASSRPVPGWREASLPPSSPESCAAGPGPGRSLAPN